MASAQVQQALALHNAGQHEKARPLLLACVQREPGNVDLLAAFGLTLMHLGQVAQFEHFARRAVGVLAGTPSQAARAWTLLGVALLNQRRGDEALDCHRKGCALAPADPDRLRELCNCANLVGDYALAAATARRGLELRPGDPDFLFRAAANTQLLGRAVEAEALFAAAIVQHPGDPALAEALAQCSHYVPGLDPLVVRQRHDRFGDLLEALVAQAKLVRTPARRTVPAGQPLRVGLISPDFRRHSVAWFVEPLLRHHDASAIELWCYNTAVFEDEHSARLKALLPATPTRAGGQRWRWLGPTGRTSPAAAAGAIVADGIDVLVDLVGLTENNAALVLAQRPAPVQVTYLGYPSAMGLSSVGWRLVDAQTDPAPAAEALSRHRLVRLDPCFLCWQPPSDPGPGPTSVGAASRPITFGSTNALMKINDRLLALWGRVLAAVPGSQLVVKARGLERASTADDLRGRMAAAGLDLARCSLRGGDVDHAAHLRSYAHIDVLLDTWPYHGTTTTLEALWMGVPVVSLVGNAHASRVGLSILSAVGLRELAAEGEEQYVAVAATLAMDAARRERLRAELRTRVEGSAIADGPGFCRRFERALREIWASG